MYDANVNETNVLAVRFEDDDKAYAALAALKQLDGESRVGIHGAAVVTRDASGRVIVKDGTRAEEPVGTATGGLLGLLIGVLGGPLGIIVGGATGVLVGSLFDLEEVESTDSVLAGLSAEVQANHNTLLVELDEPSDHGAVDAAMQMHSGTVLRRPSYEVEAEIAAAQDAQREARKQARKRLREERQAKQKAEVQSTVAAMKAKLPGRHEEPAAKDAELASATS